MKLIFCKQININLSYKMIPLILVNTVMYVHICIYAHNMYICKYMCMYICTWIYVHHMNVYHLIPLTKVVWIGLLQLLKITKVFGMSQERIELWSWCFHAHKHKSLLQVDSIISDGFGQACPKLLGKFAISFVRS